ncbi:hypothetical protein VNO77_27585 [Canavalia gladiata]|uniref:Uncharacterized protein n=1 Tax=Canavalia gladiata TaxID=3824 RepID=A0AAN9Q6M1_CANGL
MMEKVYVRVVEHKAFKGYCCWVVEGPRIDVAGGEWHSKEGDTMLLLDPKKEKCCLNIKKIQDLCCFWCLLGMEVEKTSVPWVLTGREKWWFMMEEEAHE